MNTISGWARVTRPQAGMDVQVLHDGRTDRHGGVIAAAQAREIITATLEGRHRSLSLTSANSSLMPGRERAWPAGRSDLVRQGKSTWIKGLGYDDAAGTMIMRGQYTTKEGDPQPRVWLPRPAKLRPGRLASPREPPSPPRSSTRRIRSRWRVPVLWDSIRPTSRRTDVESSGDRSTSDLVRDGARATPPGRPRAPKVTGDRRGAARAEGGHHGRVSGGASPSTRRGSPPAPFTRRPAMPTDDQSVTLVVTRDGRVWSRSPDESGFGKWTAQDGQPPNVATGRPDARYATGPRLRLSGERQ